MINIKHIWAIILRDWRNTTKWQLPLILLFVLAAILLVGFGIESSFSGQENFSEFFSIGILVYVLSFSGINYGLNIVREREKYVRLLLVSPVSKFSILVGTIASSFLTSLYTYFALLILLVILTNNFSLIALVSLIALLIYITVAFHSFGIWISTYFKRPQSLERIIPFIAIILFVFSGATFPIKYLPNPLRYIFYINPLTYCIELARKIIMGSNQIPLSIIFIFLTIFGLISIILGTYKFDKNIRE